MNIQTILVPGAPWPSSISSVNRQPEKLTSAQRYGKKSKVLDYLKTLDDYVSVTHIAAAMSLSYKTAQNRLKKLRECGLLVYTKKPAPTRCGKVGIIGFYMAAKQEVMNA